MNALVTTMVLNDCNLREGNGRRGEEGRGRESERERGEWRKGRERVKGRREGSV